jgi:chromate reductase, NAD(P)H dehydrogenase (quinone)
MQLLTLCGSLQAESNNRRLLTMTEAALSRGALLGHAVRHYAGLAELPHFNPDLEAGGPLAVVEDLRQAVAQADALLMACPEYGHSLPGALKNAIDWLIGSGELEGKLIATMASTPSEERGRFGLQALHQTLGAVKAQLVGGVPIPRGNDERRRLEALLADLYAAHQRLKIEVS